MKKILGILIAVLSMVGCTQIDTGNVGVEATLGQVKPEVMNPGFYWTVFKTVKEVCAKDLPLQLNDLKPSTSDKINLDDLDIDVYVTINPSAAPKIMTKWPGDLVSEKGEGCDRIGMNYVTRMARGAIYDVVSKIGSATIHTERNRIEADTVEALQKTLDKEAGKDLFMVRSANVRSLVTDKALDNNIKAAAQAQFKKQEEVNKLENAKIVAERQRVEAQGEADATRIKAEAISSKGGAEYVQLEAIKKWDGKLPTTNATGSLPFINAK